MEDAVFQSENIVAQVVEGLANVLHPTDKDNGDNLSQMANATIYSTKMLPQILHQMKQM